jgi:hypothetical protein
MFKHIALRIAGTIAAVTAFVVIGTSQALAVLEPGLGQGGGAAGEGSPPPVPAATFNWPLAIALAVAVIAAIGLLTTVRYRRHHVGQHA